MSIHKQPKDSPEEQLAYEAVKSLNHYNKPHGQELVLYQQFMDKRIRAGQQNQTGSSSTNQGSSGQDAGTLSNEMSFLQKNGSDIFHREIHVFEVHVQPDDKHQVWRHLHPNVKVLRQTHHLRPKPGSVPKVFRVHDG